MIKIILIAVLAFCGAYGWRQRRVSYTVGAGLPIVCAVGAVLVIRPELSTQIAQYLGVGRGSDLVLYLWMAVSLLLLANIHFRLRSQNAMITLLAREIAIQQAEAKDADM
jgi:hypothetical protein